MKKKLFIFSLVLSLLSSLLSSYREARNENKIERKNQKERVIIEDYYELPFRVRRVLDTYDEDLDSYKESSRIVQELELIGWTADFGLDAGFFDFEQL